MRFLTVRLGDWLSCPWCTLHAELHAVCQANTTYTSNPHFSCCRSCLNTACLVLEDRDKYIILKEIRQCGRPLPRMVRHGLTLIYLAWSARYKYYRLLTNSQWQINNLDMKFAMWLQNKNATKFCSASQRGLEGTADVGIPRFNAQITSLMGQFCGHGPGLHHDGLLIHGTKPTSWRQCPGSTNRTCASIFLSWIRPASAERAQLEHSS